MYRRWQWHCANFIAYSMSNIMEGWIWSAEDTFVSYCILYRCSGKNHKIPGYNGSYFVFESRFENGSPNYTSEALCWIQHAR